MNGGRRPPRLAQRLLHRALPGDRRDDIGGDLEEVFCRIASARGLQAARQWYWREALMHSARFLLERIRERSERVPSAKKRGKPSARSFRLAGMLSVSPIDLRLGVRMLVKNPGLTIVSTVALAIAIAIVAGFHAATQFMVHPTLPVPDGDRVVAIWQHDIAAGDRGTQTLGDMLTWARDLETLEHVGGFRLRERGVNFSSGTRIMRAAEITPSAFELLRVPPELGRPLVDADAQPGMPAVAVIGYDFWQTSLNADPSIVGESLRIGGIAHTIVGVMPDGFAFPQAESIWTPMPTPSVLPDQGPEIDFAFGRLAPDVSLEDVDAELQVAAARLAAEYPRSHDRLRPRVTRYAESFLEAGEPGLRTLMQAARMAVGVLLLIVAVNVGALIYARNAARVSEIAIRTALGASRRRIVVQMFIEALVLSGLAAVLGVAILLWPLIRLRELIDELSSQGDAIPFWFDFSLGSATILLIVCLTLLSAVLTGALPALKLTARGVQAQLQRVQQGSSGLKFGRTATLIIVSQVALSVALLTVGSAQLRSFIGDWWSRDGGGLARAQTLTAALRWDLDTAGTAIEDTPNALARAQARRELGRRAVNELDVQGATFQSYQGIRFFAPDSAGLDDGSRGIRYSYTTAVDPNYFDVLGVSIEAGRTFSAGDTADTAAPVTIVNKTFIDVMSISGDPIGQLVRAIDPRTREAFGEWLRIVGVAEDVPGLEISHRGPEWLARPALYIPLQDATQQVRILLRSRGEPAGIVGPLQALAADIDPSMVVHRARTLDEADRIALTFAGIYGIAVGFFVFAALLLSTTGIYAMMSFTTTQRTREIGIRTALGAPAARVVSAIFSRVMKQLGLGTVLGLGLGYLAADGPFALSGGLFADGPGVVIGVAVLVLAMGLLACGRPIRRALSIEPTIALRSDD